MHLGPHYIVTTTLHKCQKQGVIIATMVATTIVLTANLPPVLSHNRDYESRSRDYDSNLSNFFNSHPIFLILVPFSSISPKG